MKQSEGVSLLAKARTWAASSDNFRGVTQDLAKGFVELDKKVCFLTEELKKIDKSVCCDDCQEIKKIARDALSKTDQTEPDFYKVLLKLKSILSPCDGLLSNITNNDKAYRLIVKTLTEAGLDKETA